MENVTQELILQTVLNTNRKLRRIAAAEGRDRQGYRLDKKQVCAVLTSFISVYTSENGDNIDRLEEIHGVASRLLGEELLIGPWKPENQLEFDFETKNK